MGKYIKYLIILVFIIGIIWGINFIFKPSIEEEIKNYLYENGFTDSEYTDLLVKEESDTKKTSFSLGDYTYMLEVNDTKNGMETSLNATYNYKDEKIIYSYRVRYNNAVNVWFKGEMQDENFTCDKEFSSATLSSSEVANICELANINVKIFQLEGKTLFKKYKYIDYIKNR